MWKSQLKSLPTVCSPGMLSVVRGEPAKARLKAVRQSSSPLLAMKSTKLFSSWNLRKHPRGDTSLIQGAGGTERPVWGPGVGSTSQWGQTLGPPRTERAVLWDPCWERGACATADVRQAGKEPWPPLPSLPPACPANADRGGYPSALESTGADPSVPVPIFRWSMRPMCVS